MTVKNYSRSDGKLKNTYNIFNVCGLLELYTSLINQHGEPDFIRTRKDGFTLEYYNKIIIAEK